MRLFAPSVSLMEAEPSRALVQTPLGTMAFEAFAGGGSLFAERTFVGKGGLELRRYETASAEIEILLLPFLPKLPEGMRVDACLAAVWRVRAERDAPSVSLRAEWEPGARNQDGGYDGGEHLMSLVWDAPGLRLSVGTSDEDMLLATARQGELLPKRLETVYDAVVPRLVEHEAFAENERYVPRAVRERDGLEVELPPLLTGERAQVHLVVAWRRGEFDWQDVSTWYAVDVSPREIARIVEEALERPRGGAASSA